MWPKEFFPMIAHVLGKLELEELCDLCFHSLWGFAKVVSQFVESHSSAYVNFMGLSFVSLLCFVFMNIFRFLIMLVRLVFEGGLAHLYGLVWATSMCGMSVMVSFEVPSFANESTMSFPLILV